MIPSGRLIVQKINDDCWSAWFGNTPQVAAGGEFPSAAIKKLLLFYGEEHYDLGRFEAIDEATTIDRQEFRLPRKFVGPATSVN